MEIISKSRVCVIFCYFNFVIVLSVPPAAVSIIPHSEFDESWNGEKSKFEQLCRKVFLQIAHTPNTSLSCPHQRRLFWWISIVSQCEHFMSMTSSTDFTTGTGLKWLNRSTIREITKMKSIGWGWFLLEIFCSNLWIELK